MIQIYSSASRPSRADAKGGRHEQRESAELRQKSLKFILFTVIYLLVSANPSIAKPDMGSEDQKNAAIEDDVPGDSEDEVAGESEDEVQEGKEEFIEEVTEDAESFKGTKRETSAQPSHKVGSYTGSKSAMGVKKGEALERALRDPQSLSEEVDEVVEGSKSQDLFERSRERQRKGNCASEKVKKMPRALR